MKASNPSQEIWYLKVNQPTAQQGLVLRFVVTVSDNGFRQLAETWALFFQRQPNREVSKDNFRQVYDLRAFSQVPEPQTQNHTQGQSNEINNYDNDWVTHIGPCEMSKNHSKGSITSKGRLIEWNLSFSPRHMASCNWIPSKIRGNRFLHSEISTNQEDLIVNGSITITGNGTGNNANIKNNSNNTITLKDAAGMQAHIKGPRAGHSWISGHCNSFVDQQGSPSSLIFEGFSGRVKIMGFIPSPLLSAFFFFYQDKTYYFNSLWDLVRLRSSHSLTEWNFQADRKDLSFRGHLKAEHKDFTGIAYEDTNGSLLYGAISTLSELQIHAYRRDKLEGSFYSNGSASFEVISREKNPYVALLV